MPDNLPLVTVLFIVTACAGGSGDFGGTIGQGDKQAPPKSDDTGDANGQDADAASPPAEVSGAFLTCGYLDDLNTVKADISTNQNVGFACGLFKAHGTDIEPADTSKLDAQAGILCQDQNLQALQYKRLPLGQPMFIMVEVSAAKLACAIQVEVRSAASSAVAFRKSIPAITSYNVAYGFNASADLAAEGGQVNPQTGTVEIPPPSSPSASAPGCSQLCLALGIVANGLSQIMGSDTYDGTSAYDSSGAASTPSGGGGSWQSPPPYSQEGGTDSRSGGSGASQPQGTVDQSIATGNQTQTLGGASGSQGGWNSGWQDGSGGNWNNGSWNGPGSGSNNGPGGGPSGS